MNGSEPIVELTHEGCECKTGQCWHFGPQELCIEFKARTCTVDTRICHVCQGTTWHVDSICEKCNGDANNITQ